MVKKFPKLQKKNKKLNKNETSNGIMKLQDDDFLPY